MLTPISILVLVTALGAFNLGLEVGFDARMLEFAPSSGGIELPSPHLAP